MLFSKSITPLALLLFSILPSISDLCPHWHLYQFLDYQHVFYVFQLLSSISGNILLSDCIGNII